MQNVAILGSTGSLGTQTLEILPKYPENFRVFGLAASKKHDETITATTTEEILALATHPEVDIVVNVLPGTVGIEPSKAALRAGKILLLGNKESLVAAGDEVMALATLGKNLFPLDSEHNSIFEIIKSQSFHGETFESPIPRLHSVTLTASGGPFFGKTAAQLQNVTAKEALAHPTWKMGPKVTVESATLINKGLEIVEAHHLFGLPLDRIHAKVDRTSTSHAIAHFTDGSHLAYVSEPDMRHHIENSLCHSAGITPPHNHEIRPLTPEELTNLKDPDHSTFPGIQLVKQAFSRNRNLLSFLQKEEQAVYAFLDGKITFTEIFEQLKQ